MYSAQEDTFHIDVCSQFLEAQNKKTICCFTGGFCSGLLSCPGPVSSWSLHLLPGNCQEIDICNVLISELQMSWWADIVTFWQSPASFVPISRHYAK